MKYSELGLTTRLEEKQVKLSTGAKINVKQYLSIADKMSLIDLALSNSMTQEGYYDPMMLDVMFNLYVVFCYCNLEFTDEEKKDIAKIYDELLSNGDMKIILDAIPENEYNELFGYLEDKSQAAIKYNNSVTSAIVKLITEFPKSAEEAKEIVDNFDAQKYGEVINFAKAVNNGKAPK